MGIRFGRTLFFGADLFARMKTFKLQVVSRGLPIDPKLEKQMEDVAESRSEEVTDEIKRAKEGLSKEVRDSLAKEIAEYDAKEAVADNGKGSPKFPGTLPKESRDRAVAAAQRAYDDVMRLFEREKRKTGLLSRVGALTEVRKMAMGLAVSRWEDGHDAEAHELRNLGNAIQFLITQANKDVRELTSTKLSGKDRPV